MAGAESGSAAVFVGRTSEVHQVRSVVSGAVGGRMGAVLVSGDAGVGKTRLVERVCSELVRRDGEVLVLPGVCLPMGATTVPLMPLRTALRRVPAGVRRPDLSPGALAGDAAPVVVDEWLDELARERPVVLVVDDVHWADEGSLDVLTYVLAGPPDRRLALLLTLRRGEDGPGRPLQRWLADVRRLPSFTELSLSPFDRAATRDQLHGIFASPPYESLVTDVQARTGGNAYLNRLLVEELPADALHLGEDLPDDLRGAVLRPWHRLSVEARELVLAIAIGGEEAAGPALARAVALTGTPPVEAPRLLHEAVDAGVLDASPGGGYWFHHPLQAEALESFLAGEERGRMHAAFAAACEADLEARAADGPPDAGLLAATAAVAEHHRRAGRDDACYRWTVRAADLAERLGDGPARLLHLGRLVDLRRRVPDVPESRLDLLDALRTTAMELGDHEVEHEAVEAVLAELDPGEEPLRVAELLVRREHLRFSTGRGFLEVDPLVRAVELSRPFPESWQHAFALAECAQAMLWADDPQGAAVAAAGVEAAEASGHPRALAYALTAEVMAAEFGHEPARPGAGARAVAAAAESRDWWGYVHAALWEANAIAVNGTLAWSDSVRGRREELAALGGPHPYLAWMAVNEADAVFRTGDWRASVTPLRVALGSDPGAAADVMTRLLAAELAVVQGRQTEAEDHLARADELFTDTSGFLAWQFDTVRALVRLGADDPEGALAAAMAGIDSPGVPPTLCEWLCPIAARALADLAVGARAAGRSDAPHLERLDALVARLPQVIIDGGVVSPAYRARLDSLDALYAAEVARAHRAPDAAAHWTRAAELLDATLPWDAVYARWRAGEACLVGGGSREAAVTHLRRARVLAEQLRAEPVLREVRALAASARIGLDAVTPVDELRHPALTGLTAREREILGHVVAGRTYGEIARALFVSEKTVSSHVSNLLRKTGTANRVELAVLARHEGRRS